MIGWLLWLWCCVFMGQELGLPVRVSQAIRFVLLLLGLLALFGVFGGPVARFGD